MANFLKAMNDVFFLEHRNNPYKLLHKNHGENSYTFYGIYPYTKLKNWKIIQDTIRKTNSLEFASYILSKNDELKQDVLYYYYKNYWQPMGLDMVTDDNKASEIMTFIVNVGIGRKKQVIKAIQRICNTKVDGILGPKTIKALNECDSVKFDKLFDKYEISFYENLVRKYKNLRWALKGWIRRALYV